jgi:hypothetical protein
MLMQLSTLFRNFGFTKNWQARCPACRRTVNLTDLGFRREAPRGMTKRAFGWCRTCRTLRLFHIEPVPLPDAPD